MSIHESFVSQAGLSPSRDYLRLVKPDDLPPHPLTTIRDGLLSPYKAAGRIKIDPDAIRTKVLEVRDLNDLKHRDDAESIVYYQYLTRYGRSPELIATADGLRWSNLPKIEMPEKAKTLVALHPHPRNPDEDIVVATLSTQTGEPLEFQELFEMEDNYPWPFGDKKAGEIMRLAYHPVFDLLSARRYPREVQYQAHQVKREILHGPDADQSQTGENSLYKLAIKTLQAEGVEVPIIVVNKGIASFLNATGIMLENRLISGAVPADSLKANAVRREFSKYWQPNLPDNVGVYIAPTHVSNLDRPRDWYGAIEVEYPKVV